MYKYLNTKYNMKNVEISMVIARQNLYLYIKIQD